MLYYPGSTCYQNFQHGRSNCNSFNTNGNGQADFILLPLSKMKQLIQETDLKGKYFPRFPSVQSKNCDDVQLCCLNLYGMYVAFFVNNKL